MTAPACPLSSLGWNARFEQAFEPHAREGLLPGRVAAQHRGAYVLYTECGELRAEVSGRLRHGAGPAGLPVVGDWVARRDGRIHAVLPRLSAFTRKVPGAETEAQVLAANLDSVLLVSALTGDLNLRRLERYLTAAWESGARPVAVLTKADLCADVPSAVAAVEAIAPGVPVHAVSNITGAGLDELGGYFAGHRTAALLGSSGVGKSTLINRLCGRELQRTQELRADGRGRHTTAHRELFLLPGGGLIVDTPGLRELQLWEAGDGIREAFDDVEALAAECRFADCRHGREPGCAVLEADAGGALPPGRLEGWRKLQRELRALEVRSDKRAHAEERRRYRTLARSRRGL